MIQPDRDALVDAVRARASWYPGCTEEQALTYACEDVLESTLPTRTLDAGDVAHAVDAICQAEDLDTPALSTRRGRRVIASADLDTHTLCLARDDVTMATVLHEIAHLACAVDTHGVLFRDEFVRLCRAHIGVDHAALLHSLYGGCGLEVSPWAASGRRPG